MPPISPNLQSPLTARKSSDELGDAELPRFQKSKLIKADASHHPEVSKCLLQAGFKYSVARQLTEHELQFWNVQELNQTLRLVDATVDDIRFRRLKSFEVVPSLPSRIGHGRVHFNPSDFVKPRWKQIQESADTLGALCVNKDGDLRIVPPGGYAALSHVWAEGLGSDETNGGLHRSLVVQLFDKLAHTDIEWLWIDSLAIPGTGHQLDHAEAEMKSRLINAMANIYRQAKQVVIVNALALRLWSNDPADLGVVLGFGRWLTRVWTYQQIKLVGHTIVLTREGSVWFTDVFICLKARDGLFTLAQTFLHLQRHGNIPVQLADIVVGCTKREASDIINNAGALFPVIGLEWKHGLSLDDGMRKIYEARRHEAVKMVLYHGPPRATYPAWAPAWLNQMRIVDREVGNQRWETRGIYEVVY
ncbi:hypothetical protein QC762_401225 [Podospora pseudocomata]|uniref:Heterokaryon incompatibility domain-containing protein n=1 Tax=Podospora pseudocomata TaxID=2093779 RepID=A0ABR0GEF7_9PEZI|nr:hypothetical protein QC762_401225 [Podospora pseudocomata]